jgi:hypothetical protein
MIARIVPDLPRGRVWVAADEVYGRDGTFRAFLEEHRLPYAVAVPTDQTVLPRPGWRNLARLGARVADEEDWVELPAGPSQLDSRRWQWWVRRIPDPEAEVGTDGQDWARWVIARRRPQDGQADKHDYYLARGPEQTTVEELVQVPGARWRVEEAIKLAKSAAGMDDYEVRSWHGWYRHITLAQLAAAFLAAQAAAAASEDGDTPGGVGDRFALQAQLAELSAERGALAGPTSSNGPAPIPLTAYEIPPQALRAGDTPCLLALTTPQAAPAQRIRHALYWSRWRRCHQALARACHRRRNRNKALASTSARPPPHSRRTTAAQPISK